MKKILLLSLSVALLLLSACTANPNNQTAISFKGGTITEQEVTDQLKKMDGADSAIQQLIIYQIFEKNYGDKVSEKDIDKEYNQRKEQLGASFDSQLKLSGYTEATFKEQIKQGLAFQEGLKANVNLTDEDLKKAWDSFHPEVEAQLIKFASEDEAKESKKAIDNGEDFSKLANEKSIDTETKEDGGEINFDSQTTNVPNEVKKEAFKLNEGEVSDVITAKNTITNADEYFIVKMVKQQAKGNDMAKHKNKLEEIATEAKIADPEFQKDVLRKELKEANVKIKDEAFKQVLSPFISESSTTDSTTKSVK
ncbi:peptidylprolyl isomerase [Enterococcus mundtii]|uniref:peptidylprolyl isomerase n=1 Tax=Enterococcus mundtii TaxID=53346 RepID=UPI001376DFCC|nr:peptidylprolyl isomerase [Enterococcus mundtii]NBA63578.1 peptidylprolyl isomerase [Enterococcus mundtii]